MCIRMSASLQWSIIRNNSSFLVKSLGNTFTKVCLNSKYYLEIYSYIGAGIDIQVCYIYLQQEPNNLTGKNAFKYNGLVNKKVYNYFITYSATTDNLTCEIIYDSFTCENYHFSNNCQSLLIDIFLARKD